MRAFRPARLIVVVLATLLAAVTGVAVAVGASDAPPGWLVAAAPERMQMTVQAPVTGTLTSFPVKVLLKPDSFDYTHADAQHLTFTAGGDTTPLPYDVEQWDPDGTSTVWVKLPALSSAAASVEVYFGSGAPANATSPAAVWDGDYLAVNHFTTLKDSTANGFDGTPHGTNELGLAGENGGKAMALNGTDGDVDFGATMGAPVADYTFSTAVNVTAAMLTDGAYHQIGGRDQYSGAHAGEQFSMLINNGHVYASQPGKATSATSATSTVTAGWHTFTQTFDGSALRLYIDGALAETASGAAALPASGTFLHFLLGTYTPNAGSTTHTAFAYDELRLSDTPRSADWINAEYLSQTDKLVAASHYQTQDDVPGTDPTATPTATATPTGTPPANWQVPAARQRLQTAVKAPGIGSTLTNFPVLVQFGTGNFDYGDAAPDHLLFVTDDAATPLPYEIERWNTHGTSSVWVKVPSLSATGSTLNLYYDGTPLNTTDAADVWDAQYESVNHFGSDEGTLADSTQNGFDGTAATGAGAYLADTGSNTYGFKLSGSGFIDLGAQIGADLTHYTYSATVDVTPAMASSTDSGYHQLGGRDEYGGAHPGEQFSMLIHLGHAYASVYNVASTSTGDADSAVTAGWHTFTQSYDDTTLRLYIDGTLAESVTTSKPINQAALSHFLLGAYTGGASSTAFTFDEFRLSTDARSADWIKAEALAQGNQLATPAATSQNQNGGVLLSITSPYASDAVGSSVALRGAVDQPATVTYKLDSGDEVSLGSVTSTFNTQLTGLTDGDHHLVVTATGQGAGNTTTRTIDFTADVTGPEIVFNTPHDGQRFAPGQSIKLDVAASDPSGIQSTTLTIDGTAHEDGDTLDDLAPGAHTLVAIAADRLNNSTTKQIRFTTGANATFGDVSPADGTKGVDRAHATLQITPTSLLGGAFDVAFKRGYVADGRDGGITAAAQGSSTAGTPGQGEGTNVVDTSGIDAAGDGSGLTTSSTDAYPYQRFTVKVPADIGSSTFTAKWSGTVPAGDRVALSVWNKTTSAWKLVDSATGDEDTTSLSGDVAVADTVTDGKAQLLVQDAPAYVFGDGGANLNTAWLTDTQFYSESNPTTFNAETQWVLDHNRTAAPADKLSYGFLTGDIVNVAGQGSQWTNASPAMQRWDDAGFPYGIVEGNHDVTACNWTEQNGCGPSGEENSQLPAYTTYSSYFGEDRYADNPWYGGSQYDNVQHYDIVSTPKADYLFVYLDFYLTPDEITWANKVIKSHPNANVVLATHEYTNQNGSYVTEQPLNGVGIGKRIYDQIAAPNKNVVAVFSGHVWPTEHWQAKDMGNGRVLDEILYDPQSQPNQGNGWIATVGFDMSEQTITKKQFSVTNPSLGNNYMGNEGQANFTIPMSVTAPNRVLVTDFVSASAFGTAAIGAAHGVASGSPATVAVPASMLTPGEPFAWYAEATDADGTVTRSSLYELTPATGFDTAAVLIAGTPKVGETLTADTSGFSPQADAYTYRWSADGVPIDGATGSTLKLTTAMARKAITVSVHATKDGYPATDVQSAPVTVVDGDVTAGQVTVSGDAQVGHTVSAKLDGWDPQPDRVDYQWLHDGAEIAGATSATYDIPAADAGKALSVRITVHGAGYNDLEAVSAGVPVARGTLAAGTAPSIGGTVKVGKTVTAAPGSSSPADDGQPSYQWLVDGKELAGQTQPTYPVQPGDADSSLRVRVTYHRAGYADLAVDSGPAIVAKGDFTVATPAISGSVKVGEQVSAVAGAWSPTPASVDYEWLLDGKPIAGATDAMHTVGASELGHALSVTVHVHAAGYDGASATSAALTVAAGTLQATTDPTMRGTFQVGATIDAIPGTWSHEAHTTGYQWLLDDQPIPGATSSTYTLPQSAAGHWLSVQVKAGADGYTEAVATSQRMSVTAGPGGPDGASTSAETGVNGAVPATLALTLGAPATFGRFTPGVEKDYTAAMSANVVSSAGDAALSVSDPGHLSNGAFSLASPLQVSFAPASWSGPVANATVAITLAQHIAADEKLRTGTYAKTLTFTLSTTAP